MQRSRTENTESVSPENIDSAAALNTAHSTTETTMKFSGRAGEYFGIWIVNILLSVVTLGIYSAWAKVRNRRYFYGHTDLAGHTFDYVANPVAILKGRLIAFVFFALYIGTDYLVPGAGLIFVVVIWLAIPWLIIRGRIFNAHNTSYRNIRFNFSGAIKEAVVIYILFPLATILTAGILYPYVAYRMKRFYVDNHGFGQSRFTLMKKDVGYFYAVYIGAVAILGLIVIVIALLSGGFVMSFFEFIMSGGDGEISIDQMQIIIVVAAFYAIAILSGLIMTTFIQTLITNHVLSNTELGDEIKFCSSLKFSRMFFLYFTNALAIIVSLGLAIPWAKVRMWRYRTQNLHMSYAGDLDSMLAEQRAGIGATGEEIGEVFDVEMGF